MLMLLRTIVLLLMIVYGDLASSASSERLRDGVDRLKDAGPMVFCRNVAEYFDDGLWARSMGIADAVLPLLTGEPRIHETPAEVPRDGVHHPAWALMTPREKTWYAALFHAGWKAAGAFIIEHPQVLFVDPHDFTGVIPLGFRMQMKQDRFERCLREWPPREV